MTTSVGRKRGYRLRIVLMVRRALEAARGADVDVAAERGGAADGDGAERLALLAGERLLLAHGARRAAR